MPLAAGTRLGPYEMVAPLGAGAMGEVYRARDARLEREVAVKVLPAEVANDPDRLRRFAREAKAASALSHPNLLVVHDVGSEGGVSYLVTELLRGESLRAALGRGPLPLRRALDFALQVARGLAAAHADGIVHRDLKPENLFLTESGTAKILDFGLARREAPGADTLSRAPTIDHGTAAGAILGTPGYLAPEQARGERADARSDVFALGCVLYEMLSGVIPFQRASAVESLHATLKEEPPPLPPGAAVPPAVEQVVRHCLEKAPERRFQSAADLVFALEQLTGTAVPTVVTLAPRPAPARGRRTALAAGLAAVALALAAALSFDWGGVRTRLAGRSAPIDAVAVLPLANFSGDPAQDYFADGTTEALIAELAKIRALKVISRTSVMQYRNVQEPLPEIARALGVDGIVEGSVARDGDQVRITVQLVDAREDRHLWAGSYTRAAKRVLELQSEVARSIAREIGVAVSPEEERALAARREVDPEAHRLLLQAEDLVRRGATQREVQTRILELVERAIALDPGFAAAHAARGKQLFFLADTGYEAGVVACPGARAEAERALELDPDSVAARNLLAWLRMHCDYDWTTAESAYLELLRLAPGDASVHQNFAVLLDNLGRFEEALAESRLAWDLDPLNDWIGGFRIQFLASARRFAEARAQAARVLDLSPESIFAKWALGNVALASGDPDGALAHYLSRKVAAPDKNFMVGLAHALAGRQAEARAVLDFLYERRAARYVPATMIAVVHGGLGERDAAFEWLARGVDEHALFAVSLAVDPMFDPLRADPRLDALLARMKLPKIHG
jgi:serine/threonine-protein kinase